MSKPIEKALVPELRFPEFRDASGWIETPLGNICKYWNGASHEGAVTESGSYFLISLNSIDIEGNLKPNMKMLSHTDNSLQKDDLIMVLSDVAHGNFLGLTDVIPDNNFILNQRMAGLRLKDSSIGRIGFLRTYINNNQKYFKQNGQGSSQLNLSKSSVTDFPVLLPSPEEQQKIANCLSSIDELITAHTQKHDALKAHKKGLMQQLFPAVGETVPKLRFPEFWDAGEWVERPLKKVFSIFQGYAFSSKDSVKDGVRWLKIADVSIQHMNHNSPSYLPIEHKGKHDKFAVKQGDYVIALTRPILRKQLKMAPVDKVFDGALLNQRVGKLVTTKNIAFVYFLLQTSQLINDIEKSISGSEPPNLSAQQIENIKTYIPSGNIEQQKIADCLSSIDSLITTQTKKIKSLKTHKKGLMQQLFPSADEAGR